MSAIPPSQAIFAGSSPNVTCVAEFDGTVDVPLILSIIFSTGDTNIESEYSIHMESYTRYTRTFTIKNIEATQEYTCAVLPPHTELPSSYILMVEGGLSASVYARLNVSISEYSCYVACK